MTRPSLLFYVSGHGFGHATRVAALLEALRRRRPRLRLLVRTAAPARLFPGAEVSRAELDDGMAQRGALDVDLPATLAAHERLARRWDSVVVREAGIISRLSPALVVGDIPAAAFAAARVAGVRSAALGNFSWDWIFRRYGKSEPRFRKIAARYAEAYSHAEVLLRLPMACPMPAFRRSEDVPLVARRSALTRARARRRLGLSPRGRVVLVSFGGFGAGELDARGGDDLSAFAFVGFSAKPRGLKGEWRRLPRFLPMPHVDLVAAADVVLSKPGYGTVAEAVAHGVPLVYVEREGFPEIPALVRYVRMAGAGVPLSRSDFAAGRWAAALETALRKPPPPIIPAIGAEAAAERLLALAGL